MISPTNERIEVTIIRKSLDFNLLDGLKLFLPLSQHSNTEPLDFILTTSNSVSI